MQETLKQGALNNSKQESPIKTMQSLTTLKHHKLEKLSVHHQTQSSYITYVTMCSHFKKDVLTHTI